MLRTLHTRGVVLLCPLLGTQSCLGKLCHMSCSLSLLVHKQSRKVLVSMACTRTKAPQSQHPAALIFLCLMLAADPSRGKVT